MREAVRFIHKMGSVPDDEVRKMMSDLSDKGLRKENERKQQRSRLLFAVLRRYSNTPVAARGTFTAVDMSQDIMDEFRSELKKCTSESHH